MSAEEGYQRVEPNLVDKFPPLNQEQVTYF